MPTRGRGRGGAQGAVRPRDEGAEGKGGQGTYWRFQVAGIRNNRPGLKLARRSPSQSHGKCCRILLKLYILLMKRLQLSFVLEITLCAHEIHLLSPGLVMLSERMFGYAITIGFDRT